VPTRTAKALSRPSRLQEHVREARVLRASATGIAAVKSGAWFATVAQLPAPDEGELGMIALIKAMKTGKGSGSQNPVQIAQQRHRDPGQRR